MEHNEHKAPSYDLTDDELVHQIRNGDRASQNSLVKYLYQRFYGMVVHLVNRLGGDKKEDPAFILNDALVVLIEKIKDGTYNSSRSSISTYLYAIAEKQQLNRLRKRKRHQQHSQVPAPHLNLNDVEEKINTKEVREKVATALKQLDEPCREVLRKYWLEGRSMKVISEEMGITVDAVKQRNHRCMKRLRGLLENDFGDWFKEK